MVLPPCSLTRKDYDARDHHVRSSPDPQAPTRAYVYVGDKLCHRSTLPSDARDQERLGLPHTQLFVTLHRGFASSYRRLEFMTRPPPRILDAWKDVPASLVEDHALCLSRGSDRFPGMRCTCI
eukprot:scaffold598_cov318-Pavlova_lutheri.AAC.14